MNKKLKIFFFVKLIIFFKVIWGVCFLLKKYCCNFIDNLVIDL